jgi:hypothetical protein
VILEGIVTTLAPDGRLNVAPMGPRLFPPYSLDPGTVFELRPFGTSHTAANLRHLPEGVLHTTDDVLLLAQAAIGSVLPPTRPAHSIHGHILVDACRAVEFRITDGDFTSERLTLRATVVHVHRQRDFFGLNRAKHAVVEAAILATRTMLLPASEVLPEFDRLAILVQKTGSEREHQALALLLRHVQAAYGVTPPSPQSAAQN